MTTGPIGSSSIDFITGSVVVPFTLDTTESSWFVTALTTLDLPAFLRPKKPMCTLSAEGVSFKLMCIPPCPMSGLSSRLLAFGKGGSLRKSQVETSKSFVHLFKGGRVWDRVPRSRGCKERRSRLPARSALDGAHRAPAPLPSPTPKKGRRMSPSWGGTEPGGLACGKGGLGASTPAPGAIACVLACRLGQR